LEFLRRCPACGRRFSVRVERKVLVEREADTERILHNVAIVRVRGGLIPAEAVAEEVPIERDTFEISYECKHCHHEWSEKVPVVKKGATPARPGEITPV
jgi:hypothetical protein